VVPTHEYCGIGPPSDRKVYGRAYLSKRALAKLRGLNLGVRVRYQGGLAWMRGGLDQVTGVDMVTEIRHCVNTGPVLGPERSRDQVANMTTRPVPATLRGQAEYRLLVTLALALDSDPSASSAYPHDACPSCRVAHCCL
jgi:hypothetical protein